MMREKKLSIRLGDKLHAELTKRAEKYNQSISEYVRGVLIKEIEKEEKKMDTKSKKVIVYWVMGSDGVAGKYYDSSKRKWVFIDGPSTHWEAYEEMKKSDALVCPQCGQIFYQHIGENWDAVEYEFNNHLDFCEEE
jgi:hypothetical protein